MFDNLPGAFVFEGGRAVTTVTASATAHTKGSWVEIDASTSAVIGFINITTDDTHQSANDSSTLLDIGTGSAGSESVIVPNIPIGHSQFSGFLRGMRGGFSLPVWIPASSRVAVRIQSAQTSKSVDLTMYGCEFAGTDPTDWPGKTTTWEHLGVVTGSSTGTALSGTSWTEVVASTANTYQHIIPMIHGGTHTTMGTDQNVDFGTGAAASEVSKWEIWVQTGTAEQVDYQFPQQPWFALYSQWTETSGTRLAAKADTTGLFPRVSFLVCQ